MPLRRAALVALQILLLVPSASGRDTTVPGPPPDEHGGPGKPERAALESLLPRRCGVCHLDKAPSGAIGLVAFSPPGGRAGAGAAGICYSCHNGIVRDDRRALWSGRHHPAAGKVSCGSCHTPHVLEPNVRPFMRYQQGSYAFCTACHPGRRAGDTGEHPAVAAEKGRAQDCGGCHVVHGGQGEGLIRASSAEGLCAPCHGENPSRAGRGPGMTTHPTGKSGPPCLGCHKVHRSAGAKTLLDKAALDGRFCRTCHERNYSSGTAGANHPVAFDQAVCLSCHRMHNAEKPGARRGLLAAAWTEPDAMCRRCHAEVVGAGETGSWNHPLDLSTSKDNRSQGARLARAGAFFAPGGRVTCLSCHRSHAGKVGTPQLATTRESLCLHCHPAQNSLDIESAALGVHPIAVKPRQARVDASFLEAGGKTGPGGELICSTCHRAHGGSPGTPGLVLPRTLYSCLLCHPREAAIASTPHSTARAPRPDGAGASAGGMCGGCHGEHGWQIQPGKAEAGRTAIERLCATCHRGGEAVAPFSEVTNHPLGVASPPGRGTTGLPLFWRDGRRYRQGVIGCATCHDVHRAGRAGHFLRESAAGVGKDLCFGCHVTEGAVAGTRHDLSKQGGATCGPCHSVHGALAIASWPAARGGNRAEADLGAYCGGCHGPEGAAAGSQITGSLHPFSPALGPSAGRGVGCVGCHDPHRWNPADATDRGGSAAGDAATNFLVRSAAGSAALCTGCHEAQATIEGTAHDLRSRGARAGVCAPCHRAHGPQPLAVAPARSQESGGGSGRATDPCEVCHAAGGMAARSAVAAGSHPVGVSAGQDYGPDVPLYGPSGRRQPAGKIACATCHDPHRWSPAGGAEANSKAATSFLRMGADGYSPLCFPCHSGESMVVGTDHDLRVTAPKTVNRDGENPDASGVCGTCHAMHGGRGGRTLWNRESGEGRDQASRACTSCHRVGNDLGARVPPRAEAHLVHMPGSGPVSRVFTMGRVAAAGPAGIPLFAADGSPPGKGYLSCVSCHDVHRWEAGIANSGSGVPVEGDATNSFLRVRSSALNWTFCADCHGDSLLEHFRNYHFPEGR